jgi:hypothetical protein
MAKRIRQESSEEHSNVEKRLKKKRRSQDKDNDDSGDFPSASSWLNRSVELEEGEDAELSALVRGEAAKFLAALQGNKRQLGAFFSEKRLADGVDDDPALEDEGQGESSDPTKKKKKVKKVKKSLEELREESRKNRERQMKIARQQEEEAAKAEERAARAKAESKKKREKGKLFGVNDDIWDD